MISCQTFSHQFFYYALYSKCHQYCAVFRRSHSVKVGELSMEVKATEEWKLCLTLLQGVKEENQPQPGKFTSIRKEKDYQIQEDQGQHLITGMGFQRSQKITLKEKKNYTFITLLFTKYIFSYLIYSTTMGNKYFQKSFVGEKHFKRDPGTH